VEPIKKESAMSALMKQVRNWVAADFRRSELNRIDASELNRIAGDAGVSVGELDELVAEGADAASLLPRRLHAESMHLNEIVQSEPATLRDMQRVCSHCDHHTRCEHDLDRNPADTAWQTYCPNVQTMRALKGNPRQD
jgi:hypothetical protein